MKQTQLAETLNFGRIILKKHQLSLANEMFRLIDGDRARLGRFLPWVERLKSFHDEESYIKFTWQNWSDFTHFDYGIFISETGAYAGNIGLHSISWPNDKCELGYWIAASFEGKGYMGDAVRALEAECFRVGFHRIEIRCDKNNARSANVPKRCGYTYEGTLREEVIEMGKRRDTMVWSKIRGE